MSDAITPVGAGKGPPQVAQASEAASSGAGTAKAASGSSSSPAQSGSQQAAPLESNVPSVEELEEVVSMLNEQINDLARELHFSVDQVTGRQVVTVVNSNNGETVRQIPPKEVMAMARSFLEGGGTSQILVDIVV